MGKCMRCDKQRIAELIDALSCWRLCPSCDGTGECWHETAGGDVWYTCPECDGSGADECPPPDPADYQPDWDVSGEDRTALVEELYRLRGGRL